MAYGNTSASALISGARAARAKQQAVNDQAAGYEWQTSAQTQDDYDAYSAYLKDRQDKTTDPSKKITLQSKQDSAFSSYTTNEIQRQSQAVATGEASNTDKYKKIYDLYRKAQATGNLNLAQNLESQLITLSKTIQDEGEANSKKALAESKKGVTQALRENAIAYNAVAAAARNGGILKDENGKEIRGTVKSVTDAQGNPNLQLVIDDKASPIRITAQQAAIAKATKYQNDALTYQTAINNGLDDDGAFQKSLSDLQTNSEFIKYTNPKLIGALSQGQAAFTNSVDAYGNVTPELRTQVKGFTKEGLPLYATGLLGNTAQESLGAAPSVPLNFNARVGADKNAPMDNYTVNSIPLLGADGTPDGLNRQFVDPRTGKVGYTKVSNKGPLAAGFPLVTKDGNLKFTKEDEDAGTGVSAGEYASSFFGGLFDRSTYDNYFGKGLNPLDAISNVLAGGAMNRQQQRVAAEQAARVLQSTRNVMSPQDVAKTTPTISGVKSPAQVAASTPTISKVVSPAQVAATTPSVKVVNQPSTQTVKVTGPKPAPAPQNKKQWWNPLSWFK